MEWLYLIVFLILWSIVDHYKEKIRLKKLSKYDATITYQLRIRDIYKYNEIGDYEEYIKKAYPKLVVSGKYLIFNDIKYKRKTEFKYETESHNEAIFSIDSHFADLTNYEEYDLSEFIEFIPGIEENPNVLSFRIMVAEASISSYRYTFSPSILYLKFSILFTATRVL